jgi:hypothetical protein
MRFESLLERSRVLPLGDGTVRIAHPLHNFLIACLHMISDKGRPGREPMIWRDVAVLGRACPPEEVTREARRVGIDWCARLILEELPPYARPAELLRHLGGARPGPLDAFRLRHLLPPSIGSKHQVAMVFRLPVLNGLAFMGGYLVPSPRFIRARYGRALAYGSWWRDAFGRLKDASSSSEPTTD